MRVTVLVFAALRESLGRPSLAIDLEAKATVRDLLDRLQRDYPGLTGAKYTVAVNRSYSDERRALCNGDQVALIPPVSGG